MSLTEKWTNKIFNKAKEPGESASMMDHVDVPHRPPPPPPLRMPGAGRPGDDDDFHMNPYEDSRFEHDPFYISSPEMQSPPPGLMAASPLTPSAPDAPALAPPPAPAPPPPASEPTTIKLPLSSRALTTEIKYEPPVFEPEKRYGDDAVVAAQLEAEEHEDLTKRIPSGKPPVEGPSAAIEIEEEDIPEQPPLIIITGAASGLGLALFQHFAARDLASPEHHKYDVLGLDRTAWRLPGKGFQWQTTIGKSGKFVQLDVTGSLKRLDTFASNYLYTTLPCYDDDDNELLGYATSIDENGDVVPSSSSAATAPKMRRYPRPVSLLIHCMRGTSPSPRAHETLDAVTAPVLRAAFDTTVVGVLQLMQTVIPHLQLHAEGVRARAEDVAAAFGSTSSNSTEWLDQLRAQGPRASLQMVAPPRPPLEPPARAVVLIGGAAAGAGQKGGTVGEGVVVGGGYAARASRAALGALVSGMTVDVPEVCFASVGVGMAEMGLVKENGTTQKGAFEHGEVVEALVPLMERLGDLSGSLASGCFVDKFGEPIKW